MTLANGLYPVISAFFVLFLCSLPEWKNTEKQKINAPLFRRTLILSVTPVLVWFLMSIFHQAVVQQWFCSMASWSALLAISVFPLKITPSFFRRIAGLLVLVIAIIFIVSACDLLFNSRDRLHSRPQDILNAVNEFWHRHRSDPIPVTYGDLWYCGIITNYMRNRPPECDVCDRPCFLRHRQLFDEKGALVIGSKNEMQAFMLATGYPVLYTKVYYPCRSMFGKPRKEYVCVAYYPSRAEREKQQSGKAVSGQ